MFLQEDGARGFSAIVGNPPFQGGGKVSDTVGNDYRNFLVEYVANCQRGSADLCAYFFLQANQLLSNCGGFGLIGTNTIAQGDTREVGLDQLVAHGCVITRAVPSRPWFGAASLEVASIWICKNQWKNKFFLADEEVTGITAFLTTPGRTIGNPYQLKNSCDKCFKGSDIYGMGFTLKPDEAEALISKDQRHIDILFPFLNGDDLNSNPQQSASRWIINFRDWSLDAEHDDLKQPKGPPYASDYPDCLKILIEKVKPESR